MTKSLDEIKELVKNKYLGKGGIHGVGISQSENVVRLYIESQDDSAQQAELLEEIEREAAPYRIVSIKSDRSSIT